LLLLLQICYPASDDTANATTLTNASAAADAPHSRVAATDLLPLSGSKNTRYKAHTHTYIFNKKSRLTY
jgi:hypothetical protein